MRVCDTTATTATATSPPPAATSSSYTRTQYTEASRWRPFLQCGLVQFWPENYIIPPSPHHPLPLVIFFPLFALQMIPYVPYTLLAIFLLRFPFNLLPLPYTFLSTSLFLYTFSLFLCSIFILFP
jgi:hypothetical protein